MCDSDIFLNDDDNMIEQKKSLKEITQASWYRDVYMKRGFSIDFEI